MFLEILGFYLQGLLSGLVFAIVAAILWTLWRVFRHLDKTAKERQAFLYDLVTIILMTVPVLSTMFHTSFVWSAVMTENPGSPLQNTVPSVLPTSRASEPAELTT